MWFDSFTAGVLVASLGVAIGLGCLTTIALAFVPHGRAKLYGAARRLAIFMFYIGTGFMLLGAVASILGQPQHVGNTFSKLGIPAFLVGLVTVQALKTSKT